MNFEQAHKDITNWVVNFVEVAHPALNNWPPCPYARRARLDGRLDIRPGETDPYTDCRAVLMGNFDVIAYVYDPADITADAFNSQISALNRGFLVPRSLLALADHPDYPEQILGVTMNQGNWAICFIQNLDKLNDHARMLARQGYYHNWPEEYLSELFEQREDPRL
jgi:hypothetical protein